MLGRARGPVLNLGVRPWPPVPAHHVQLIQKLVDARMIVVTLGGHEVQGPAVLTAEFLHQVVGDLLGLGGAARRESRGSSSKS